MVRHLQRARLALRAVRARRGDDGVALVAAIGVAIVALMLATTVVAVTVRSTTATGEGRDRDQAYAAAEAGLDAASAVLTGGPAQWASLCPAAPATTTPAVTLTATSTYQTVVTFGTALDSSGGVTGGVACGAAGAAYAQVVSTGTGGTGLSSPQKRALTAVMALSSPISGGIVANSLDLTGASSAVLRGGTSSLPVRVTTGDGSCGISQEIQTDVIVSTGKLVTSSSCRITGSVKAAAGVTTGASSVIDGGILTKPGMPVVRGASSTTGPVSTSATDPAWNATSLPRITETLDAWTSQGFTTRTWASGCTLASSAVLPLSQGGPTIYDTRTTCPSGLSAGSSAVIRASGGDVVLLANAFTAQSSFTFASDTPGRRVWLIVPAPASGSACPTPRNISLGSSVGTNTAYPVKPLLFLYTPCSVALASSVALTGQVWGGQVTVSSSVVLTFADLGIPSGGGSSATTVTRLSTS